MRRHDHRSRCRQHAAGSEDTPPGWAVNVIGRLLSGPKPLFWLSYRRPRRRPETGRQRLYGSFLWSFQGGRVVDPDNPAFQTRGGHATGRCDSTTKCDARDLRMGGQNADAVAGTTGASGWTKVLARYRSPNSLRSLIEIVITIGPFALLWALAWLGLYLGYWFSLL